jgi:hypothetical protein
MVSRRLNCNRCDGDWSAAGDRPQAPVSCPYCNTHVCGCGCGADLSDMRRDAIYLAEAHCKDLQRRISADVPPIRSVAEARAIQEDAKAHWSMVADEGIYRFFAADPTAAIHADDLRSLGIPDHHCNVIGSQIAKWVNRERMVACGRRKSSAPGRNGAKSNEYRLTEAGVEHVRGRIAGVGGAAALSSSLHSGEGSPESASPSTSPVSGEPARLFDSAPTGLYKDAA